MLTLLFDGVGIGMDQQAIGVSPFLKVLGAVYHFWRLLVISIGTSRAWVVLASSLYGRMSAMLHCNVIHKRHRRQDVSCLLP